MPRYHFHTADGAVLRDEEGEELSDLDEAKSVAITVLSEMLPIKASDLWKNKTFAVNVKDDSGRLVVSVVTVATVDPIPRPDAAPEI